MGILRLYLALCVIASHTNRIAFLPMHSGEQAVQVFFMVSGFYMELVYEKYRSAGAFYLSRAQRIFFPYWTILGGILLVSLALGILTKNWGELTPYLNAAERNGSGGVWLAGISNFSIFGQDAVYFLKSESGQSLSFTPDFRDSSHPLWHLLAIPQAWSVGVELIFYLLTPLLAGLKSRWLAGVLVLSLTARFYTYHAIGWHDDPWSYRFIPFELCFFILGMLSCRFWKANRAALESALKSVSGAGRNQTIMRIACVLALCFMLKVCIFTASKWMDRGSATLLFNSCWMALLPVLFSMSRSDGLDREVGELSYPIYLIHYFIISLVMLVQGHPGLTNFCNELGSSRFPAATGTIVAAISIVTAWGLNRVLFNKFDAIRHSSAKQ